jgi:hypothetical protein
MGSFSLPFHQKGLVIILVRFCLIGFILCSCTTHQGDQKFSKISDHFYTPEHQERQKGEVYLPQGKGPFPGVVLVHGGGRDSRSYEDMNSI